ncbi:RcpC/CpaB family pilus assembly protein [Nesterenkonia sp. NBAIMH1]|uniref:RcpC/CpaB family pilus assembly protein n=1 Tax=Nesterenkonia sp. NBAIMH1 TaxID=2600320 RepID=UPI00143D0512|nr:RcpC/CpaB family pilus assembly protein [Nesterenkonia sp. NBAIMH1]
MPRALRRFRAPLALLMGAAALVAVLMGQQGGASDTVTAVRVTVDVPAGELLSASMLEEDQVDAGSLPEGYAHTAESFEGEAMAAPLPAGAVLHPAQLVGPGLLQGHPAGTVAVPVRPADTAILGFMSAGQRVDVLASSDAPEGESAAARVVDAAPVLWVPQGGDETWLGSSADSSDVVILGVDAQTAEDVAEAGYRGRLDLVLTSASGEASESS